MEREKKIYEVTLFGALANVLLLIFKFSAGILAHSSAMIADAVHSLSDFATDIVVFIFVRISGKPQDETHDYGHGKYETLASTIIGIALIAVSICIIWEGAVKTYDSLCGKYLSKPGTLAFWAAVVSILIKEIVFRYTDFWGRRLKSDAVRANALHHRSDALSSIGTAAGIGLAILLGDKWVVLDPIASIVVGIFILRLAFLLLKRGIDELMERSLPDETEREILEIAASFEGVVEPHDLRTRRIGRYSAIELHILMEGSISLKAAHDRASDIENALRQRFGDETHIAIHVEPLENPEIV